MEELKRFLNSVRLKMLDEGSSLGQALDSLEAEAGLNNSLFWDIIGSGVNMGVCIVGGKYGQ